MGILTEPMKEFLLSDERGKWRRSIYYGRIIEYAVEGLKDLTLIAEKLPEKKAARIFNNETLLPLLESIFNMKAHDEKEFRDRRKRLLKIWNQILLRFGDVTYALKIARKEEHVLMHKPALQGFEMLYAMSMMED